MWFEGLPGTSRAGPEFTSDPWMGGLYWCCPHQQGQAGRCVSSAYCLVSSHSTSSNPELHKCYETLRREEVAGWVGVPQPGRQEPLCCLGLNFNLPSPWPSHLLSLWALISLSLQNRKRNPCWFPEDGVASYLTSTRLPFIGGFPASHYWASCI